MELRECLASIGRSLHAATVVTVIFFTYGLDGTRFLMGKKKDHPNLPFRTFRPQFNNFLLLQNQDSLSPKNQHTHSEAWWCQHHAIALSCYQFWYIIHRFMLKRNEIRALWQINDPKHKSMLTKERILRKKVDILTWS